MVRLRVGGDLVWCEDSAGGGEAVVLLHPGVGDSRIWDAVVPGLLAAGLRVVRYDVRGYGRSQPATEPYVLVEDLVAVLDALGIAAAHLLGCSMGGAAALDLALLSPARVTSLTLLCPGVSGYPWPSEPWDVEAERLSSTGDTEALLRLSLDTFAAVDDSPDVIEQLSSAIRAWPNEAAYQRLPALTAFERLSEVRTPSTLLVGTRDRPSVIACAREIARRIRGCRFLLVDNVDHFPPTRIPDQVTALVLEYVAGTDVLEP